MIQLKKREWIFIYATVSLLLSWLVLKVVFVPFQEKLHNLGRSITVREAKLSKGAGLIEHKEAINKEYDRYDTYYLLQGLTNEETVARFLKEIEEISRKSKLVISDIKPQKDIVKDKFSEQYLIDVKAEGTLEQFITFLYKLFDSTLLFGVERMILVPKTEDSSQLRVTMKIEGVSFL